MQGIRGFILAVMLWLPLAAADMTTLTIHVTNQSGKPVDHASVVVNEPQKTIDIKLNPPQPQYSAH